MKENHYYFADNQTIVDFVLVCDITESNIDALTYYLEKLEAEGLQLEKELQDEIKYIKVHATKAVLFKYCDALQVRLPIKDVRSNLILR